jgi:hypothetical protein
VGKSINIRIGYGLEFPGSSCILRRDKRIQKIRGALRIIDQVSRPDTILDGEIFQRLKIPTLGDVN